MEMIERNPTVGVYAASPDYVHALEVRRPERFLFVSGTMGLDESGAAGADIDTQLNLIWSNLLRILKEAEMGADNVVRLTSYLRNADFMKANQDKRVASLGNRPIPTTTIVVETLSEDWLVEIEIVAAA